MFCTICAFYTIAIQGVAYGTVHAYEYGIPYAYIEDTYVLSVGPRCVKTLHVTFHRTMCITLHGQRLGLLRFRHVCQLDAIFSTAKPTILDSSYKTCTSYSVDLHAPFVSLTIVRFAGYISN